MIKWKQGFSWLKMRWWWYLIVGSQLHMYRAFNWLKQVFYYQSILGVVITWIKKNDKYYFKAYSFIFYVLWLTFSSVARQLNHHLLAQGTVSSRTFGPPWFYPVEPPDAVFILKDLLVWTINGHLRAYIQVPLLKSVAQGCFYLNKKKQLCIILV